MKDFAASEDPAVQAQLDRLAALSLPQGRLGLDTIRELLALLGDPQKRLPPTFHVAPPSVGRHPEASPPPPSGGRARRYTYRQRRRVS